MSVTIRYPISVAISAITWEALDIGYHGKEVSSTTAITWGMKYFFSFLHNNNIYMKITNFLGNIILLRKYIICQIEDGLSNNPFLGS